MSKDDTNNNGLYLASMTTLTKLDVMADLKDAPKPVNDADLRLHLYVASMTTLAKLDSQDVDATTRRLTTKVATLDDPWPRSRASR